MRGSQDIRDDAPLEERRVRAVSLRRTLPESVLEEVGKLGPAAMAQVTSAADPLNLVGIIVPGERVPANSGRTVAFRDGVPVAQALHGATAAL